MRFALLLFSRALLALGVTATILAQGPLEPPAAPAPSMKTLDQIQPRTPIEGATSQVTIDTPGSYYLTGNIAVDTGNGVVISTDNVTLDLNGFSISSSAKSLDGNGILLLGERSGVHIFNGHIQGTLTYDGATFSGGSFNYGIFAPSNSGSCRITNVSVIGVHTGMSAFDVESCSAKTCRFYGIIGGIVSRSHAENCGSVGIIARNASDCIAEGNSSPSAIQATTATNCSGTSYGSGAGINTYTAEGCWGQSDSGTGITALVAQNSYGFSTSGIGLNADAATNCRGESNTSNGIRAKTATNCYGYSNLNRGISCDIATASYGVCASGASFGINAAHIATGSYGMSSTGFGLAAYIANSCRGDNNSGPAVSANFKYNMP